MVEKADYTKDKGDTGPAGPAGDTGPEGPEGPEGPPGTTDYEELENVPTEFAPSAHHTSHESGGSDEISIPLQVKIGTLTRDMTAATGTVGYTGVGFEPTGIFFFGTVHDKDTLTLGLDNTTLTLCLYTNRIGTFVYSAATTYSILVIQSGDGSKVQAGKIHSFDADGFTISWSKFGTPAAGTAYIHYIAF